MSKKYITLNVGSGLDNIKKMTEEVNNIWIGNVDCTPYAFTYLLKGKINILPYKIKQLKKTIKSFNKHPQPTIGAIESLLLAEGKK